MSRLLLASALVLSMTLGCAHRKICDHVVLQEGSLKLNENQRVLICGSEKSKEGWQDVPIPQARYQLNVILQNEGYLNARFQREGDSLKVWPGPRTLVKSLEVHGADNLIEAFKKRKVVGFPLEPKKLDEVTEWAKLVLRSRGYACPKVNVTAQAWDGLVRVDVETGPEQRVSALHVTGLDGLNPMTIERYQAFEQSDLYDVRETELTTSRLMEQGLFQSAYFATQCRGDQVDLRLVTAVGKPRIFRFGVGASTEEFPFADIWFKNTRLDGEASNLTAGLHVSNIAQRFDAGSELYVLPFSKQSFLGPRFNLSRENERAYEVLSAKTGIDLGRALDFWDVRWNGRVGPTLNYTDTVRGLGPQSTSYLSWEGSVSAMDHVYEVFSRDQREGWTAQFNYRGQRDGVGSPVNVDLYDIGIKYLWNLGGYAPPLLVLASRLQATTVDSNQRLDQETRAALPIEYRIFMGGDQSLRGFARESIDNGGRGYLTTVQGGFELRLIEQLPYRLEPFLLWDVARVGDSKYTLDPPLFTSYGAGLRWASPFGTLRGSGAQGRIYAQDKSSESYRQEAVYFISFGQEF